MASFEAYTENLNKVGEAILDWADPQHLYRGYTEVRAITNLNGHEHFFLRRETHYSHQSSWVFWTQTFLHFDRDGR